jgi:lipid II:glycine glycyltransferase (peptidoglycan interpeptide bridge formation enzyme)
MRSACEETVAADTHVGITHVSDPNRGQLVQDINPLSDPRWSELVEKHPRASVFHSTHWLEALRNTYGYDPLVISTASRGSQLTNGLVFCRIKSRLTGNRLVSLPFSDHCDPLADSSDELDEMLLGVKRLIDDRQWKYAEIRPFRCEPSLDAKLSRSARYCVHRLDLRSSTEQLFRSFHRDCVQRKIRRATREKLRCEEGTSEVLLQHFYRLLVMTRRRQSLPPQPLAWFRSLIASFGSDLKIRVAYQSGLPIASILTLSHKRSLVYKYGCSDARFNRFGGMALLFWNAIQAAKNNGCEELDMGRSDTDNAGLIAFKEHWGARRAELSYWTYPYVPRARSIAWQRRLIRGVVAVSPTVALKAFGNLLYRHIG